MSRPDTYRPPVFTAPIDLDLSRNEGRPGPAARSALAGDLEGRVGRYPDTTKLREGLAARFSVDESRVLVTAGGDDALFRCFLSRRGGAVVSTSPTFEMIPRYAAQTRMTLGEVEWWEGQLPVEDLIAAGGPDDMVVIVSPNNPTGAVITSDDLARLAKRFALVVWDAAYSEFADEDLTPAALDLGNLVMVRTMSKAYGLAGLRVGCLVGSAANIEAIGSYGNPYPLSAVSAEVARRALDDPGPTARFVDRVRVERAELTGLLPGLGARPLASQANFVLARFPDADWVTAVAASLGVGLRTFPRRAGLDDCVRITLPGDETDFRRLVTTLAVATRPEAVIFDLDGVLADVSGSYRAAIIETAASFGVEVTPAMIGEAKAEGNANDDWDLTRRLCRAAGADVPLQMVKDRFEQVYQGNESAPGLKDRERLLVDRNHLAALASRLPLAVVTGRPRADADTFLDRFGLDNLLGVVITREDAPMKPDPGPVTTALAALGVDRAWMLGDTRDDLEAARAAGVVPIGVIAPGDDPAQARATLATAAAVLDNAGEIMEVLDAQEV